MYVGSAQSGVQAPPRHQSFIRVGVSHNGLARPKVGSYVGGCRSYGYQSTVIVDLSPNPRFSLSDLASASFSDTIGASSDKGEGSAFLGRKGCAMTRDPRQEEFGQREAIVSTILVVASVSVVLGVVWVFTMMRRAWSGSDDAKTVVVMVSLFTILMTMVAVISLAEVLSNPESYLRQWLERNEQRKDRREERDHEQKMADTTTVKPVDIQAERDIKIAEIQSKTAIEQAIAQAKAELKQLAHEVQIEEIRGGQRREEKILELDAAAAQLAIKLAATPEETRTRAVLDKLAALAQVQQYRDLALSYISKGDDGKPMFQGGFPVFATKLDQQLYEQTMRSYMEMVKKATA